MATYWAVLIGINYYVKPTTSLTGCVHDIDIINQYITNDSTHVHVNKFTASAPSEKTASHPSEDPESWPTYENITSSITKITAEAQPGDFVHIHYSGHGTQLPATSSEYSNKNTGDLALVLFDGVHGSRYLRGLELASLLNQMVKKGLLITLVLDCCFSGSTMRHGDSDEACIRFIEYDPAVDNANPRKFVTSSGPQADSDILRDAQVLPQWLIDPSGYTIITACGPHEKAFELKFEDEMRNGALSYFLTQALTFMNKCGVKITNQSLHQHLCAKFHASWPQQNPMCYGNKNLSFFGKLMLGSQNSFISIFRTKKENRLCLRAGYAHGVYKDDQYAIYPLELGKHAPENVKSNLIKVRVDTVRGLTSDLVEIDAKSTTSHVKTGWKALPLTSLSPRKIFVRLMDNVSNQSLWLVAAKQRRFLQLVTKDFDEQPCLFNVKCNARDEYEIIDDSYQEIISLPTVPVDMKEALDAVVGILEHLSTFKYIEGIENRVLKPSFYNSFTIQIEDPSGEVSDAAGVFHIKDNDELKIMVQNTSNKPLYFHIYNLRPSWQISGLICDDGGGDCIVVLPKDSVKGHTGKEELSLQMTVPETFSDRGHYQCEDILKFFITSRPSSFSALELPEIPISAKDLDTLRSDHHRLSGFLASLATPVRGAGDDVPDEQWATREIVVRTSVEKV